MESTGPSSAIDAAGIFLVLVTVTVFFIPLFILFPPVPPLRSEALAQTHLKLGLDRSKSNLKKQATTAPNSATTVRSLWIYPVKSCTGIELQRSKVLPQGLEFDRLFMFAQLKSPFPAAAAATTDQTGKGDQHTWHFITQRQFPLLATVKVELYVPDASRKKPRAGKEKEEKEEEEAGGASAESFVILRFPRRDRGLAGFLATAAAKLRGGLAAVAEREVLLPVAFPSEREIRERWYDWERVTIWKETVEALNMGEELPEELRLYLGVSNKLGLFRVDPGRLRQVMRCAPRKEEAGYQPVTGFQDAYPLHLINLSSVGDLEAKVGRVEGWEGLDVRRFRANIIVDGAKPYDEDEWKAVRLGASGKVGSRFHVSCRTVRCKMPNVDQDSGFRHPVEPDKSLRKYREVDEGAPRMGCLGMQMTPLFEGAEDPEAMESWVEVGMDVEVLGRGDHVYIKQ